MEGKKGLSGTELVEALLLGSTEIDRMRKEIDTVINLVSGFINARLSDHELMDWRSGKWVVFVSPSCRWTVQMFDKYKKEWVITCWLPFDVDLPSCGYFVGYSTLNFKPNLKEVKLVYDGLPTFVEGMKKEFPFLGEVWQPLLDAAVAAKDRR